ncbi:MAG: ParB family transcriptional regulator, chromosome partitioning protein [Clostridia bacterium]|jgi:ParB family chromosome partitioning protein|nr:ParB family transcriptional regulator, chromosome partitioning protein [Clostridia bacterium]
MKDHISKIFGITQDIDKNEIKHLDLSLITPNPFQPRRVFDPAQLEELAQSIKEFGVLQPIIVRKIGTGYELVAGERRFRASQLLGLQTIPAIIRNLSDKEIAEMALIENLQREDLNYFEEAEGYAKLIKEFGITQDEVAKRVGKSQSTIANKLRLLNLSPTVQREISVNVITERHARALLKLNNEKLQLKALNEIYINNLNVRQTDELVEQLLINNEKVAKEKMKRKMTKIFKDMRIFLNTIRGAVQTIQDAGLPADITENEYDDYLEVTIRLPKNKHNVAK